MKKNYNSILLINLLGLVFILYSSNCLAKNEKESTMEKKFNNVSAIQISMVSGNCLIVKGEGNDVKVNLSYNYKPAKNFEPVFVQENEILLLKENMLGSNSGSSDWTITVPEHIDLKFNSASGSITLSDIKGKFEINTASGSIIAKGISIRENSNFVSASGYVQVSLKEGPQCELLLSSSSGIAILDYNNLPIIGTIEMKARVLKGEIQCPFKFDHASEKEFGGQLYDLKYFKREKESPTIRIYTASGKAVLKK
jgi:hypothetical protein